MAKALDFLLEAGPSTSRGPSTSTSASNGDPPKQDGRSTKRPRTEVGAAGNTDAPSSLLPEARAASKRPASVLKSSNGEPLGRRGKGRQAADGEDGIDDAAFIAQAQQKANVKAGSEVALKAVKRKGKGKGGGHKPWKQPPKPMHWQNYKKTYRNN